MREKHVTPAKNTLDKRFHQYRHSNHFNSRRWRSHELPISLLVFDETGSTFLSALVLICGVLPDIVLSVLVAPLIDKGGKKKWIVGLDIVTAVLYAVMGLYISGHAFNYLLYLIFVLGSGNNLSVLPSCI